jgi:DNA-binding transcriptional ArsR family regulator
MKRFTCVDTLADVPHPSEHSDALRALDPDEAEELAESVRAFSAGSRLRLMWAMADGEQTVEELCETTGLSQSSASQQLRILRQGRVVAVRRDGRHAHYRLHDHHVVDLLTAIRHHHEHVHPPAPTVLPSAAPGAAGEALA